MDSTAQIEQIAGQRIDLGLIGLGLTTTFGLGFRPRNNMYFVAIKMVVFSSKWKIYAYRI
jgi:hypothetical protein